MVNSMITLPSNTDDNKKVGENPCNYRKGKACERRRINASTKEKNKENRDGDKVIYLNEDIEEFDEYLLSMLNRYMEEQNSSQIKPKMLDAIMDKYEKIFHDVK